MILLQRRRLILWLLKAYFKKWRKTIFISFALGLIVFFLLKFVVSYFIPLIPFTQEIKIGIAGAYLVNDLPVEIVSKVSRGLVYTDKNNLPIPDLANSWEVKNSGKTYIFYLKENLKFSDGTKFTSDEVKYNFSNVDVQRPNKNTIIFNLKNSYSPFLLTVSRPIFRNGLNGIGDYKVRAIDLNGDFVQSITLALIKDPNKQITYQFYPTEDALKTAFVLGDVDQAFGIRDLYFKGESLKDFKNTSISKDINYSQLVTIFYNTKDRSLSDKRLRQALAYTIPDNFNFGQRNYGPFPPDSWVNQHGLTTYSQDFEHAKLLIGESESSTQSSEIKVELKTLSKYKTLAEQIKKLWQTIGVKTDIKVVDGFPQQFQIFLGEFTVSKDPDQYTLWHSSQENNITQYKNLRIDKLLEDGRQTTDIIQREKIYADFQKYLLDDPPAIFLYFPYEYNIIRK